MRTSLAAFALLVVDERWLVRWNERWAAFNLVGGHKEDDETFRQCCLREVNEELGLVPEVDFTVTAEPIKQIEYDSYSKSAGTMTRYTFELFEMALTSDKALETINADPENLWIDDAAILRKQTPDGRAISDTVERVLRMAGLISPAGDPA